MLHYYSSFDQEMMVIWVRALGRENEKSEWSRHSLKVELTNQEDELDVGADGEWAVKNDTQYTGLSSRMIGSIVYWDRKKVDLGLKTKNSDFEYIKFEISMRHPTKSGVLPSSQMDETAWPLWKVDLGGKLSFHNLLVWRCTEAMEMLKITWRDWAELREEALCRIP